MKKAFYKREDFDGDISQWNRIGYEHDVHVLRCENFDHFIGSWDVSNVADMSYMFYSQNYNKTWISGRRESRFNAKDVLQRKLR